MFYLMIFFFFKQKTAYEMRISDWSSDVCSSDLSDFDRDGRVLEPRRRHRSGGDQPARRSGQGLAQAWPLRSPGCGPPARQERPRSNPEGSYAKGAACRRSEEHTSELQSLMRISYAVFCLKKKKTHTK